MNNGVRIVYRQQQSEKNRVHESRSLLPVRRPVADTNGCKACIEVNSNETTGRPDLSSIVVENESVIGTFETESVNDEDVNTKESDELKAGKEQHLDKPNVCELNQTGQTDVRQQLVGLNNDLKDEFT
jgi:hypothetical protein